MGRRRSWHVDSFSTCEAVALLGRAVARTAQLARAEDEGQHLIVVQRPHAVRAGRLCRDGMSE